MILPRGRDFRLGSPPEGSSGQKAPCLTHSVSVSPSPASIAADSGYVLIVVTARNTESRSFWVPIEFGPGFTGGAFWFAAGGVGAGMVYGSDTVASFAPGQVRRYVFTQRLGGSAAAYVGAQTARGGFSSGQSAPVAFEIVP